MRLFSLHVGLRARSETKKSYINLDAYRFFTALRELMKNIWTFLLLSLGYPVSYATPRVLKLISEWKSIDFNFPTQQLRHEAIASKAFVPGKAVLIDVDVQYTSLKFDTRCWNSFYNRLSFVVIGSSSRVFVTFPRFREGIPVTLGTRSEQIDSNGSNLIDPYPNYSWHRNPTQDCANKMVSVFRVAVSVTFKWLC